MSRFEVGDRVIITNNYTHHNLDIGEEVFIQCADHYSYGTCRSREDTFPIHRGWVSHRCIELVSKGSVKKKKFGEWICSIES